MRHGPPNFVRAMQRGPSAKNRRQSEEDRHEVSEELRTKLEQALAAAPKPESSAIDPEEIRAIQDSLRAGKLPDGVDLHDILNRGSKEERLALRRFFTTPLCAGRNQDLLLSSVRPALAGKLDAQQHYEKERLVLAENLPEWVRLEWERERSAAWRKIDLFERRVTIYVGRKFQSSVLPEFRFKQLPIYEPESIGDLGLKAPGEGLFFDVRGTLLTMGAMREMWSYLDQECKLAARRLGPKLFPLMKAEVELGLQLLLSPTIVGVLFRERALQEMTAMFAAFLIEDAVLACDLPASPKLKLATWQKARFHPWQLRNTDLLKHGEFVARELRKRFDDPDDVVAQFERIMGSPQEMRCFRKQLFRPARDQVGAPPSQVDLPNESVAAAVYVPPRNRKLEILAALESFRRMEGEEHRYARAFTKLVRESEELQSRVMFAIENGGDLEQLILELRAERPISVLNEDLESEAPLWSTQEAQRIRMRLFGFEGLVDERPKITFRHTPEALERLRDGRIRHAVERVLDKFTEKPELADIKPIVLAPGVWELREHSTGARVYYLPAKAGQLVVLLVGSKPNQVADVALLPKLRDRESAAA